MLFIDTGGAPTLYLHKQSNRTDIRKAGGGDVPAGRAGFVPAHLQRDVVSAVRKQGPEALSGMDAVAVQQQAGMGICVIGTGEFKLTDLLCHRCILLFLCRF